MALFRQWWAQDTYYSLVNSEFPWTRLPLALGQFSLALLVSCAISSTFGFSAYLILLSSQALPGIFSRQIWTQDRLPCFSYIGKRIILESLSAANVN